MNKFTFNLDNDLSLTKFLNNDDFKNKSIFVSGSVGVGKTMLGNILMGHAKVIDGKSVQFVNMHNFIAKKQEEWNKDFNDSIKTKEKINFHADLLVIDDLGAEFIHSSTIGYLYEFFENRFAALNKNHNLKTIIISNYTTEAIYQKYSNVFKFDPIMGQRINSRLSGLFDIEINLLGKDKRINFQNTCEKIKILKSKAKEKYIQDFNKDIKPNLINLFDAVDKFNIHKQEAIAKDKKFFLSKEQLVDSKNIEELYKVFIWPLIKYSYKLSKGINGRDFSFFYWLENLPEEQSLNIDKNEYSYDPFSRMKFYLEQIELEINKRYNSNLNRKEIN